MESAVHEASLAEVVLEVLLGVFAGGDGKLPGDEVLDLLLHPLYVLKQFIHRSSGV